MGVVWLARRRGDWKLLAVKVPRQDFDWTAELQERWRREIEIQQRLRHPNIVRIERVHDSPAGPCIVMPYLEGGSLRARLSRSRPEVREVLHVFRLLVGGLKAAHDENIIHRDIKPGNILFGADGNPYLADFGLGRDLSDAEELTLPGCLLGTRPYWAPQQARGRKVGKPADIWALGFVLCEWLTGRKPTDGPNPGKVRQGLRELRPDLPGRLRRLVCKCLQHRPSRRYQDAGDLLRALEACRDG
jgi:serine/threonine-protein kinase